MSGGNPVRTVVRQVVGDDGWAKLRAKRGQVTHRARKLREQREWKKTSEDLRKLAEHFGTDKWGAHRYAQHYQNHFAHLRLEPVKVLEIGIGGYSRKKQGGASLRMWKHWFPNGQIVGLDLHDKRFVEEERIKVYVGDQTDPELLNRINAEYGPFDVIIDDGSHISEHIVKTFAVLFPLLKGDGIYVVEDTQTSYWPERGGSDDRSDPSTSMNFLKQLTDGLNYEEFVDDDYTPTYSDQHVTAVSFYHNIVFIQKGSNTEGTKKKAILKERYGKASTA
jgi:cephalosporin hydroxylase